MKNQPMNLIEFIGFIVTVLMMGFLFLKRLWEEHSKRKHPEEYAAKQKKQKDDMRKLMKTLNLDYEDDEELPPPPRLEKQQHPKPAHHPAPKKSNTPPPQPVLHQVYQAKKLDKPTRASNLLHRTSLRDAFILRETLGPPRALEEFRK